MTPTPAGPLGCHTCRVHLDAWAAGPRDAVLEAAVRAHLAGCPGCRRYLAVRSLPARALRGSGPTAVPEGLADRAYRAALASRAPALTFLDRFVPVAARAAVAAAVLAALVWGGVAALGTTTGSNATVSPQDPMEVAVAMATEGNGGP